MLHSISTIGIVALGATGATAATLASYNVDPSSVSVSGLSSGGFMSVQLGVAYSDTFPVGFGVFAGGPYDCARDQSYLLCMFDELPSITTPTANMKGWSGDEIDSVTSLANRKIYMWVGSVDTVVGPNVMNQLKSQLSNFDTSADTKYVETIGAGHTFPTDFNSIGDSLCDLSEPPYISNCAYDGAGACLEWLYGTLNAKNTGTLSGSVVSFEQTASYGATGMGSIGFMYVPESCSSGDTVCSLHVALHGCLQSYTDIGTEFIDNTGYNMWADTNNMIILYPQAIPDYTEEEVWFGGEVLDNPDGCWDFVGWYGDNADQIGGVQMVAITNMISTIVAGYT